MKRITAGTVIFCCLFGASADENIYPRPLPLRSLPVTREIHAADFGAVPDDGRCDVDAVQKAFNALRQAPGTRLVFAKGVYNLLKTANDSLLGQPIFKVDGLKNVQVDFGGALLLIGRSHSGLVWMTGCERVIFENLDVDYDPLPYTMGRVTAVYPDRYCFDMAIMDGYLMPDDRHFLDIIEDPSRAGAGLSWNRTWGYFIDEDHPGRLQIGERNVYLPEKIEKLDGKKYRYYTSNRAPDCLLTVKPGDLFTYLTRCGTAFVLRHNTQATFRNIRLYAAGGANFEGTYNDCLNFLGCQVRIRDGRWKSSNADGFIFHSSLRAPWIEDCIAEGMADDSVNIHNRPNFIIDIPDARTLKVCKEPGLHVLMEPKDYRIGDEVWFYDGQTGMAFFKASVAGVDTAAGTVTFDRDLPELRPGADKLKCTSLYNMSMSRGAVIKNSVFRNARRFGILLRAHDAVVEGNTFEGLSADAVTIHNESTWPEGLFGRNIRIKGNRFVDCGFEYNYMNEPYRANIAVFCYKRPEVESYLAHGNISIRDNLFEGWGRRAVYIENTENIEIKGNVFKEAAATMDCDAAVVFGAGVKNVQLDGNTSLYRSE